MNWGKKILIVYIVFVMGIAFMVYKSSTQNADLVTTDYYAKELKYQEKIDEIKRVSALSAPLEYAIKGNAITVQFPKDFSGKQITGEAILYCPSDEKKDLKKNFILKDEALKIQIPEGSKGLYELHVSWQEAGVTYYFEKKIFI
jgi:nitrogen fixation protein FixH